MGGGRRRPAAGGRLTPAWRIREAAAADADRLSLVGRATFLDTFAGVLDAGAVLEHCRVQHAPHHYARSLAEGAAAWLAEAAEGGAPVGYALLTRPDLPGGRPGADLELKRIYALSRWHGGGLGAALLERATERARVEGAERLMLGVYAGNARALAFYRKQGFEPAGERRFQVGPRVYDDRVLALALGPAR
jgi:GNAT superfamily N-acetyltransferase